MSSARLPGKALINLDKHPLIHYVIQRAKKITGIDKVALATSKSTENDALESYARSLDIAVYRGDEENVVERFYHLAKEHSAKNIIRLTGDNPLIDFKAMGNLLEKHCSMKNDYTCCQGYPVGSVGDIFSFKALEDTYKSGQGAELQDHVDLHVLENQEKYKIMSFELGQDLSENRWTVDYDQDLELMQKLFAELSDEILNLTTDELISRSNLINSLKRKVAISKGNQYTAELVKNIKLKQTISL